MRLFAADASAADAAGPTEDTAADANDDAPLTPFEGLLDPKPIPMPNSRKLPPTHHPTPPTSLSSTLRFKIHPSTKRKRTNAERMISRSYQSAFSINRMSWVDVCRREE